MSLFNRRFVLLFIVSVAMLACDADTDSDTVFVDTDAAIPTDAAIQTDAETPADGTVMVSDSGLQMLDMDIQPESAMEEMDQSTSVADMTVPPEPIEPESVIVMHVPQSTESWHDLAYLAAVSASSHQNGEKPVVIALDDTDQLGASAHDFIRRFAPSQTLVFGAPNAVIDAGIVEQAPMDSLASVTTRLSALWQRATYVVVADQGSYGDCVMAASLAARIDAPLFYTDGTLTSDVLMAIESLEPEQILVMGAADAPMLSNQLRLQDADDALGWLTTHGYEIDYLALFNPNDRTAGRSQKLSLTAPNYAARRGGLALPYANEIPTDVAGGSDLEGTLQFLRDRYEFMGKHPEHLALVGSFDVIPIHRTPSLFDVPTHEWPVNDNPYGEIDDDPFRDIAVGRIFTDSVYRGSLLAARTVVYEHLADGYWNTRFVETGLWGFDELRAIMKNVGFNQPEHLTEAQINQRPSLEAAAILHKDHSHCTVLGNAFTLQTQAVYAPAVVISRGCSVAGIDLVSLDTQTVPGNMLGRGAVAFIGAPRNSIAGNTVTEVAFFNHVLKGETLGQAMRSGFNHATIHYLDENSDASMRYVLDNEMLFGDPGLVMAVPSPPMTRLAQATQSGDEVTVLPPEVWTQVEFVPEQLAEWNYDGTLFMYVGPGAEPKTYWSGRYDTEDLYFTVAIETDGQYASIAALTPFDAPLGWQGRVYSDQHQDGTNTLRWRVRLLEYEMETGVMIDALQSARYQLLP